MFHIENALIYYPDVERGFRSALNTTFSKSARERWPCHQVIHLERGQIKGELDTVERGRQRKRLGTKLSLY